MVNPETRLIYKPFLAGRVRDDRQIDIFLKTPQWTRPDPCPALAFPGWYCDWTGGGVTRGEDVVIHAV